MKILKNFFAFFLFSYLFEKILTQNNTTVINETVVPGNGTVAPNATQPNATNGTVVPVPAGNETQPNATNGTVVPVPAGNETQPNATNGTVVPVPVPVPTNATTNQSNITTPIIANVASINVQNYTNGTFFKNFPSYIPELGMLNITCVENLLPSLGFLSDYEQAALVEAAINNTNSSNCFNLSVYSQYFPDIVNQTLIRLNSNLTQYFERVRNSLSGVLVFSNVTFNSSNETGPEPIVSAGNVTAPNATNQTAGNATGPIMEAINLELLKLLAIQANGTKAMADFIQNAESVLLQRRAFLFAPIQQQNQLIQFDAFNQTSGFKWAEPQASKIVQSFLTLATYANLFRYSFSQGLMNVIDKAANTTECQNQTAPNVTPPFIANVTNNTGGAGAINATNATNSTGTRLLRGNSHDNRQLFESIIKQGGRNLMSIYNLDNNSQNIITNLTQNLSTNNQTAWQDLGKHINNTIINRFDAYCIPDVLEIFLINQTDYNVTKDQFYNQTKQPCNVSDYIFVLSNQTYNGSQVISGNQTQNISQPLNGSVISQQAPDIGESWFATGCLNSNRFYYGHILIPMRNISLVSFIYGSNDFTSQCINSSIQCIQQSAPLIALGLNNTNNTSGFNQSQCPIFRMGPNCLNNWNKWNSGPVISNITSFFPLFNISEPLLTAQNITINNTGLIINNTGAGNQSIAQQYSLLPLECDYARLGLDANSSQFIRNCFNYIQGNLLQNGFTFNHQTLVNLLNFLAVGGGLNPLVSGPGVSPIGGVASDLWLNDTTLLNQVQAINQTAFTIPQGVNITVDNSTAQAAATPEQLFTQLQAAAVNMFEQGPPPNPSNQTVINGTTIAGEFVSLSYKLFMALFVLVFMF